MIPFAMMAVLTRAGVGVPIGLNSDRDVRHAIAHAGKFRNQLNA